MVQLVLRVENVQKVLNVCRTDAYQIIKDIKAEYPFSKKLKGSKVRTEDLADAYDLVIENVYQVLAKK
ncbi:MAG: hypothetical protein MUF58_00035 [Arcicella sp.]|jgi:hypothetical protein|nr:hypothetical protein [Arcicella sp.]